MTGTEPLRSTPLHDAHLSAGARMVGFAGWHLPLQFSGVLDEHRAVRERVGLFDVSHMGEAAVRGKGALEFLQRVTCNDLSPLAPGRAQYTALTTLEGTFVDDLLVYVLEDGNYLLVTNAANNAKDLAWLQAQSAGFDVTVEDHSDRWAQLAVQGPAAAETLQPLASSTLSGLKYYRFLFGEVAGVRCLVSRTGYTGEFGYEIYAPWSYAPGIWAALRESGAPHGLALVGLAARDTLRLEAKLALYGNDIDETTTVVEADLSWIVKPDKGPFNGREVLVRQMEQGTARKLVGFEMRGRAIARPGYEALIDGEVLGRVTSGTHSPTLRKNIGLAYLPLERTQLGCEFHVTIRGREEPAVVVPTPFYKRPKKRG